MDDVECSIVVKQIPGYYVLHMSFRIKGKLDTFPKCVDSEINTIADEIREGFNVSKVEYTGNNTLVLIKCLRKELRKIESWLTLRGYNLLPLPKWKHEIS